MAEPCRGALCWASLLPPRLDGTSIELKQRTTAKQNDGPFFLSFASRPFTTEAKNKASLILLVSFRSCSRLTLGRIRWRYFVAFFVVATLKNKERIAIESALEIQWNRSYLRSSLGLIRLRHFFVCFATLKNTDKNGSQICFKLMRLFFLFVGRNVKRIRLRWFFALFLSQR